MSDQFLDFDKLMTALSGKGSSIKFVAKSAGLFCILKFLDVNIPSRSPQSNNRPTFVNLSSQGMGGYLALHG